jgi:twinkle protein
MKTWADLRINTRGISGGEIDTECPWCSAQRRKKHARCLSVNLDRGVYLCHHCGVSGGLAEGHREAAEAHWRKPIYRKPDAVPESELPAVTFEWFLSRGIGRDVVIRNRIGRREVYMPQLEDRAVCVVFPYYRGEELVNAKYRDAHKNFRMEAGAERILYGYNDLDDVTVICEGEIDKLSIETAGFRNSVSVPDGAPAPSAKNYASKFTFLDDDRVAAVREWVIAVDNDEPGTRLEQELVRRFGIEKCRRAVWPEGCKDANDVLVKHGAARLRTCIESAEPFPIGGIVRAADLSRELDELYDSGVQRGLSTGWRSLDEFYTVRAGELTVVSGVPNSGKSNWVDGLTVNLAKEYGWKFAVFSPENQPLTNHISRIIEHFARVPFRDGPTPRMSKPDMHLCRDWVDEHFRFVLPEDEADWTLEYVLKRAEHLVRRFGINGLVIDPWNELQHERPERQTETEYVSVSLRRMRQFIRRNNLHLWLVAHPTKLYRNKNGEYPVPSLYDISGSAHFRNKADNGIVLWRDLNEPTKHSVELHIQKIRFREVGKIGGVELRYDPATGSYADFSKPVAVCAPERSVVDMEDGRDFPAEWWNR